jgi:hypothetical protein
MRTNPKLYWAPSTQMAMHKLGEEHGEEFFRSAPSQPRNPDNGQFTRDNKKAPVLDWSKMEDMDIPQMAEYIKGVIDQSKAQQDNSNTDQNKENA